MLMADEGCDGNLVPPSLLRDIRKADSSLPVTTLDQPVSFRNPLLSTERIGCGRTIRAPNRLLVLHDSYLSLSKMIWYVADKEVD
ncbi:hypothetical protein BWQ96_10086 [Gracilariopsis chorda]|uniref:Uncharacterized protein n=1 Tax=Gracilariopsis chorda TaxID=448386 RepID=A0A2V3IDN7_9FLOR|nr:hypothetical protein BWQ96_10086 [Gracilariopsis chorda]|eukprot:PXF40196.1 hypothetical protein BWQ96_10086 [Gracilariopsis chorda]